MLCGQKSLTLVIWKRHYHLPPIVGANFLIVVSYFIKDHPIFTINRSLGTCTQEIQNIRSYMPNRTYDILGVEILLNVAFGPGLNKGTSSRSYSKWVSYASKEMVKLSEKGRRRWAGIPSVDTWEFWDRIMRSWEPLLARGRSNITLNEEEVGHRRQYNRLDCL